MDPGYEMVLERALDDLVKKVGRKHLMDVGTRKGNSERLDPDDQYQRHCNQNMAEHALEGRRQCQSRPIML